MGFPIYPWKRWHTALAKTVPYVVSCRTEEEMIRAHTAPIGNVPDGIELITIMTQVKTLRHRAIGQFPRKVCSEHSLIADAEATVPGPVVTSGPEPTPIGVNVHLLPETLFRRTSGAMIGAEAMSFPTHDPGGLEVADRDGRLPAAPACTQSWGRNQQRPATVVAWDESLWLSFQHALPCIGVGGNWSGLPTPTKAQTRWVGRLGNRWGLLGSSLVAPQKSQGHTLDLIIPLHGKAGYAGRFATPALTKTARDWLEGKRELLSTHSGRPAQSSAASGGSACNTWFGLLVRLSIYDQSAHPGRESCRTWGRLSEVSWNMWALLTRLLATPPAASTARGLLLLYLFSEVSR